MSTTGVIVLAVLAAAVAVAVGWWVARLRRRHHLRERFGPEYEIVVNEEGGKRQAERELTARRERHDHLDLRPLESQVRRQYAERWRTTQARFVDAPSAAVDEADRLVEDVMAERGYPVGDVDQQMADLSVEHSDVLSQYREAHAIARASAAGTVSTEDLRRGMVHYRALFDALLDDRSDAPTSRR